MVEEIQEEFKISEIEKYWFLKTTGDHPLVIIHDMKRPSLTTGTAVQIDKSCLPKFKEFVNAKYGEHAYGRRAEEYGYFVDECLYTYENKERIYHFKRTVAEIAEEKTEEITVYWITIGGAIDHVAIDAIAIPALRKFINKYF